VREDAALTHDHAAVPPTAHDSTPPTGYVGDPEVQAHWDKRYSEQDQMWSGKPNGTLVAEKALLDVVAPGGVLLFVHHADMEHRHDHGHGGASSGDGHDERHDGDSTDEKPFDPADYVWPANLAAALGDDWVVEVDERRPRVARRGRRSRPHRRPRAARLPPRLICRCHWRCSPVAERCCGGKAFGRGALSEVVSRVVP
jgi:hypothetical protein